LNHFNVALRQLAEAATNLLRLPITGHQEQKRWHKDVISAAVNEKHIMVSA
jgi:hypothetical protein